MRRRAMLALSLAMAVCATLFGTAPAQAAPGSLRILVTHNQPVSNFTSYTTAMTGQPGVAAVDTFDTSVGTPSQELLAGYDVVASNGDSSYFDQALYGDRLANYIDAGGAVIQWAYDNWDSSTAHPTGRFESGGYPPFIPGPNDNMNTSLGTRLVPNSPLLAGVPDFTTTDNTTDDLAPGAALLALWQDGRNAIATKGQVVSVTATPGYGGDINPISAAARLTINTGNVLGPRTLTVAKTGAGSGTVTGTPAGINCGPTCSMRVGGSQAPTLSAKASKGTFTGWSGGGCTGKSTCMPSLLGGNTTVTAKFDACVVPKLKGKTLKKAKKKLKRGKCRLGKVKGSGDEVVKQRPKPGKVLAVKHKVKVTLG
jgi:PASTA domain